MGAETAVPGRESSMALLTLGDSHSLFCYAGVAEARIYWRGPVTMHRAGRDGIRSLVPKNCRPERQDILILSFGEIDCRVHIPKIAHSRQINTKSETLALCDKFELAFEKFSKKNQSRLAISCVIPPSRFGLPIELYRNEDEAFEDAVIIRDTMNNRLSQMAPLIDFRASFRTASGELCPDKSDGSIHIDSRESKPVVDAINAVMNTSYETTAPVWPHPFPMAQPPYISPLRTVRRRIKYHVLSLLGVKRRGAKNGV